MKRFARWLRLVVTCLAFVIGSPSPGLAADAHDTIVLVANDEGAPEENAVERTASSAIDAAIATSEPIGVAPPFEALRPVTRIYLANCALLL